MDRFGIGQVRLPEFHIDNFRLPVFGDSSGTSGNHEIVPHESLVDAWYFSGYSNENPPEELVGVVGIKAMQCDFAALHSPLDQDSESIFTILEKVLFKPPFQPLHTLSNTREVVLGYYGTCA